MQKVFPWFGKPAGRAVQHGFARNLLWHFDEEQHKQTFSGDVSASWTLTPNEKTREVWPHDFELTYTVTLSADALHAKLSVKNVDKQDFAFSTLLHTYFGVQNIADVQVHGLKGSFWSSKGLCCNVAWCKKKGIKYEDKTLTTDDLQSNDEAVVSFTGEVDRTFKDAPDQVTVTEGGKTILSLQKVNLKDTVVWNPWADKVPYFLLAKLTTRSY